LNNHRLLPSNRGKQPRFFYGYSIAAVSFIILMVVWGGQYSFGVFFKPLLNEFGWTRAATSGAYSLSMVLIGVFGIFSGRLSDRFGPRLVVTVCGLLIGIGYLLMSQISDIWQVYLFYGVLMSAGIAGTWVPLLSTVARWFVRRRGLASGIAASGIGVGTATMPLLANQLISSYSWRTSYIIIGLIVLVVTTVMAQFLRREPGQMGLLPYGADSVSADSQNLGIKGFSLQEAIRGRHFWIMFVAFLLGGLGVHSAMVHIVPHATDIGFSASAAAAILSAVGIVSIGSKIGMGSIIDKIGSRRVMIVVFIVMSLSYLWLLSADDLWKLYLFAVAFGVAYGGFSAAQSPIIAELFGLRVHGTIFGLAMFAANTGGAVGSLVAGRIFDISSSYHWAFLLCTILGVVGLALSVLLKVARVQEPGREAAYKAGHKPQSDR
jgi:MFS family permease